MRNVKLTLEYDGTDFCGWQRQENALSVQQVVEETLHKILGEKVNITGAGRTDSGVHAKGQVANFRTLSGIPLKKLKTALNSILPNSIRVKYIASVGQSFNARFDAKSKVYRYVIYNSLNISPFDRGYKCPVQFDLDIEKMKKAAAILKGRHDFMSFTGAKNSVKTTVRDVKRISVTKRGRTINIDVEADGFLYNMVRAIAGTLIEVGRGKLPAENVKHILNSRKRTIHIPTAPAQGLFLMNVKY